jgi:uncharacterized membrane protein
MVDIAPTLAVLLGANLPASGQGRVRVEMLVLEESYLTNIEGALHTQQQKLLEKYQAAVGVTAQVNQDGDVVGRHQAAINAAREARLQGERLPRLGLALFIALIPAGWLAWRRSKTTLWMLAGFLLYLAVFNLRYLAIDQMTYSFSSVDGAAKIVIYGATTVLVAFGLSWLLFAWGMGLARMPPSRAALLTFGLALFFTYILSLPVLWNAAWNGFLVGWTLPDFASFYLAFISLIQILFINGLAIPAAGLAAMAAAVAARLNRMKAVGISA